MKLFTKLLIAAAMTSFSIVANAQTFDLTSGESAGGGNSLNFMAGALTVNVRAFALSNTDNVPLFETAVDNSNFLNIDSNGLGLFGGGTRDIDGVAGNEFILFTFSEIVDVESIAFSDNDNDQFDLFRDISTAPLTGNGLGRFGTTNIAGPFDVEPTGSLVLGVFSANDLLNGVTTVGVGGFSGESSFRINSITLTSAVPEPATWLMMIIGFSAVGLVARRRRIYASA